MHGSAAFLALAASPAMAAYVGFNYGSTFTTGAAKVQSDFETEFTTAQGLISAPQVFSSARLYTMIVSPRRSVDLSHAGVSGLTNSHSSKAAPQTHPSRPSQPPSAPRQPFSSACGALLEMPILQTSSPPSSRQSPPTVPASLAKLLVYLLARRTSTESLPPVSKMARILVLRQTLSSATSSKSGTPLRTRLSQVFLLATSTLGPLGSTLRTTL